MTESDHRASLARLVAASGDPLAASRDPLAAGGAGVSAGTGPASASSPPAARSGRRPVVGYVCSYVPEEIILAAGCHPLRLGARAGPTGPVDSCLQSFACSFARGLLDGLLSGQGRGLGGVVFAHTCDSLRAALESWKARKPAGSFTHFLNLPACVEGPGAAEYTASEFGRLAEALPAVEGARPVTAQALTEAAELMTVLRRELSRLDVLRSDRPDLLKGSQLLAIARGAATLDREEATDLVRGVADGLMGPATAAAGQAGPVAGISGGADLACASGSVARLRRPRILVSGGFLETEEPLRLVEEAGADVVGDDLCLAGRALAFSGAGHGAGRERSPAADVPALLSALSQAYLSRVPCPTKHPPSRRLEFLLAEVKSRQVDGVVFLLQKFCDPHAFDYPAFRDALEASGRPCLSLEIERGGLPAGQAGTRVEAFLERLRFVGPSADGGGGPP